MMIPKMLVLCRYIKHFARSCLFIFKVLKFAKIILQDAQNRLLHELSLRDNEIRTKDKELANLRSELAHMREELDRLTLKNQELEKTNQQLESRWMVENMSFDQNKANSR